MSAAADKHPKFYDTLAQALGDYFDPSCRLEYERLPRTRLVRFFVVSKRWNGVDRSERQDHAWRIAKETLKRSDWLKIIAIYTVTPSEYKDWT